MNNNEKSINEINYEEVDLDIIEIEERNMTLDNNKYYDPKYGECSIIVKMNEGPQPHFHIYTSNNDEICIRLDEAKYFIHKNRKQVFFSNANQREAIYNWCKQVNPYSPKGRTNWQYMCDIWNEVTKYTYSIINCKEPNMQPDYRLLVKP